MNPTHGAEAQQALRQVTEGSRTVEASEVNTSESSAPTLKLRLTKADNKSKERRQVKWSTETVDNEHLGRKKSKCCCVFVKKRPFGQSDSESSEGEDDCDHCSGHTPSDPKAKS